MSRQMVQRARKAAKSTLAVMKKITLAVVKAAAALVGALAGLVGGGVLLVALVIIIVIAAVANSPFGLFFAAEHNAPDSVSVSQAVAQVNVAYNARLEDLQAGYYDDIVLHGRLRIGPMCWPCSVSNWPEPTWEAWTWPPWTRTG